MLRDLEYGHAGRTAMRLDLYLPEKKDALLPLIIWVHGGAWRGGSKDNPGPALQFTGEGYAVAQVGYRLSGDAIFPAQIFDCKAAVRWLRANAKQYRLDSNRFAAWGGSAGGHLVALLGTTGGVKELEGDVNQLQTSSRVQAVIDWFGPTDFLQITNVSHNSEFNAVDAPVTELLGGTVAEKTQLAAQASPITFVTKDAPPFLIIHGDQDQTVPIKQSQLFYNALKKAGVDATFIPVKGAGHGALGPAAIEPVREFLHRTLGTGQPGSR
jgi:acetyl esterase/lipase